MRVEFGIKLQAAAAAAEKEISCSYST